MRTLYIFTMASAILCTVFIIYLHTYTCFGQPANFFKQNNFGNKQGVAGAQSCPNTFFPNNLTRNGNAGNNGNLPTIQQESAQKLPNLQPCMNLQKEQPFNLQQAMAVQQMNMQAMANLEQQSLNMQQQLPIPASFNGPAPITNQPCQTPQEPFRNYNVPSPAPDVPILKEQKLSYQLPIQSTIPIQYAIQNMPQSFSIPVSGMAPYSLTQNYGIPTPTGLIGSNNLPITIVDNSRPCYNPYTNSQPSALSYFPSLNPNQGIMIGQNDIVFKSQDSAPPAYVSIVQAPLPSPQYKIAPSYPMNTVVTPDQDSKSSVKALLPILINMLKEKSTQCPCNPERNCGRKKKRTNKPQITSGYSKQKKYPLSEDGPAIENSQEVETTRNVREPKKAGKLKNTIPDESTEAQDDESSEYSEEDESEDK